MLYIKMVTYTLTEKYKLLNCTNASQILYMCKEKHRESNSWLGKSVRLLLVHEHLNMHICTHSSV